MDRVEQFILSGGRNGFYSQNAQELSQFGFLDVAIKVNEGPFEVPDFIVGTISNLVYSNIDTLSYVLTSNRRTPTQRRLVRGALSDFMLSRNNRGIAYVVMSNGVEYHGLPGAIFDADFNLLMLMTTTVDVKLIGGSVYTYILEHNCRVSPRVFQHQDYIIEKTIIKKVLPYCATHVTSENDYCGVDTSQADGNTIKVIIEDINKLFIHRIVSPKISDFTSDTIHELLVRNMDEIIDDTI